MKHLIMLSLFLISMLIGNSEVLAQQSQTVPLPNIGINLGTSDNPDDIAVTLQLLLLLTVLSLAPSILIMTTSYLRIIIVFHFLKSALGTQSMPPNQLLAGVALFITFFIMSPTWSDFNNNALQPYLDKEINIDEAYEADLPLHILIPSFVLSELRAGFIIGFFLFIPFVMVDMIVASILMSMGMMMLPPMMISMPFKILLFVLVDGWSLVIGSVVRSII